MRIAGHAALESDAAILEPLRPRGNGYHGDDAPIVMASSVPRLYPVAGF
ncbi:MAG: hypothetical protein HKP29_07420 [Silicimonas sp.]|nr:hypothetical protein [Silicimonas sp.]NNL73177.1 hypothetical protein [Silicimonas sp.]